MPKPVSGINGSGMHVHQSLFKGGENAFADPNGDYQISKLGLSYIGGLLEHAQAICAISNPLVNSYKRLVPGYEAPTTIAWSRRNRSPRCRIPATRGIGTRAELRMPDPSCNPYLAFAALLAAGLDGVEKGTDPGPPMDRNVYDMTDAEKSEQGLTQPPGRSRPRPGRPGRGHRHPRGPALPRDGAVPGGQAERMAGLHRRGPLLGDPSGTSSPCERRSNSVGLVTGDRLIAPAPKHLHS